MDRKTYMRDVYSIAPMVKKNNLGEVIDLKDDYSDEIELVYKKYRFNFNKKVWCSQFAKAELMWQSKAKDIFNIIHKL